MNLADEPRIELNSYPPRVLNAAWLAASSQQRAAMANLILEFGKHLVDGPCIVHMLSLSSAHNGPRRDGACWMYNTFRDLELEAEFWDAHYSADPPTEFRLEHDRVGKLGQGVVQHLGSVWMALRGDLSHRPEIPAEEFAKVRFIAVEELRLAAGRLTEFEANRRELAAAYATAGIEQPAWVYEIQCGGPTTGFQIWTPYQEMVQFDLVPELRDRIDRVLGERRGQVADAAAASIVNSETQLFAVNPGGSHLPSEVLSADPDFWNSDERLFP